VFQNYQKYTLRNFNSTCNNLQASVDCSDECDNKLWTCITQCIEDEGLDLSETECLHECGREEYGCIDCELTLKQH
jgi:hypothetical protein